MKFRIKVLHVFKFGGQTLVVTEQDKNLVNLSRVSCQIEIDGKDCEELVIDVDASTGKDHRDLWIRSNINLDTQTVQAGRVWLVSNT